MENHLKALALAVNYINQVMETECILCYGTNASSKQTASIFTAPVKTANESIHFDLLAITTNQCTLPDFIGRVDDIPGMDITVSLITYPLASVQLALKENNRFFYSVIKKGTLVDTRTGNPPPGLTSNFDQDADDEVTQTYWKSCCNNAISYSEMALNSCGDDHITIPLLKKVWNRFAWD